MCGMKGRRAYRCNAVSAERLRQVIHDWDANFAAGYARCGEMERKMRAFKGKGRAGRAYFSVRPEVKPQG